MLESLIAAAAQLENSVEILAGLDLSEQVCSAAPGAQHLLDTLRLTALAAQEHVHEAANWLNSELG